MRQSTDLSKIIEKKISQQVNVQNNVKVIDHPCHDIDFTSKGLKVIYQNKVLGSTNFLHIFPVHKKQSFARIV